jgi:hypothetical protein
MPGIMRRSVNGCFRNCGGGPLHRLAKRRRNVADWRKRALACVAAQTESRREDAMPVLIAAGFFILITALVIWGSGYMGPDTRANKPH